MTKIVKIASNAVIAKLFDADTDAQLLASETLSYMVEGAGFTNAFANGGWDGRSTFYSHRAQTFPAGFVHIMNDALTKAGYQVQLVRKPIPEPIGPENPIVDEFGNDDPRYDFQMKAIHQVEKHGAGIIQVATGGGKSKIAKLLAERWKKPTLFLTTRGVLMYQMKAHYESQGFNVGVIGDGEWRPVRGINVGMVQTLVAQLKVSTVEQEIRALIAKDFPGARLELKAEAERRIAAQQATRARTVKLLEIFEVVIGEEAHEAGGDSYFEILKCCKNAGIRVALTATPFMRSDEQDNMRLMAAFGPILLKVSEETLIDRGILAKPVFKFVPSKSPPMLKQSTSWARAYELGFTENDFLNGDVLRDAQKAAAAGLPVMTLVQRTQHGAVLKRMMQAAGLRVQFIKGANDNDERRVALGQLGRGEIDVLIGTNILDVGVDVPAVGLVQLAGGGKAEVALRQRIGRGLRAKKGGPNVCFIADYSTTVSKYHKDHTAQRRGIIEGTPGFGNQILPAGRDFPWDLFGGTAAKAA